MSDGRGYVTVSECAKVLDVPEGHVHDLVACGQVNYSHDRLFRTTVRPEEAERALARRSAAMLAQALEIGGRE